MNSPFHIRCDLCFPLLYPLHTSSYPTANGLIRYFRQKAWFLPKEKYLLHIFCIFDAFLYLTNKTNLSDFSENINNFYTKIPTLNQRAVRMNSPFHIRCDLCFPLLYPLRRNGSPRLNFLQSTFHKKRGFCEKVDLFSTFPFLSAPRPTLRLTEA